MTKEFYLEQMERLQRCYGEKHFNEERIATSWDAFRLKSEKEFENAITSVILNESFPPSAAKILEIMRSGFSLSPASAGEARMEREHPVQPNAAELAAKYAPALDAAIKNGLTKELPYNPLERQDEL